jgi:hypothetical protein
MARSVKSTYLFALDGGAPGTVLLRGAAVRRFELYLSFTLIVTEAFTGSFTDIDLGWPSDPVGLRNVNSGYLQPGTLPSIGIQGYVNTALHILSAIEPFQMTINGGDITAGGFILIVEAVSP